jgi:hypothetical protein
MAKKRHWCLPKGGTGSVPSHFPSAKRKKRKRVGRKDNPFRWNADLGLIHFLRPFRARRLTDTSPRVETWLKPWASCPFGAHLLCLAKESDGTEAVPPFPAKSRALEEAAHSLRATSSAQNLPNGACNLPAHLADLVSKQSYQSGIVTWPPTVSL